MTTRNILSKVKHKITNGIFSFWIKPRVLRAWEQAKVNVLRKGNIVLPCPYCGSENSSHFSTWIIDNHFGLFDDNYARLNLIYCQDLPAWLPKGMVSRLARKSLDALSGKSPVDYRRCSECDLVYRNYPHTIEAANYYYRVLYRIPFAGRDSKFYGRADNLPFVKRKEPTGEYFIKSTNLPPGSAILDIGCAEGLICNFLQKKGYVASGIELSTPMVNYAKEILHLERIAHGPYFPGAYPPSAFDGIMTHHVFEHIVDIHDFLNAASLHLKEGGYFLLQTPSIDLLKKEEQYVHVLRGDHNYGYSEQFLRRAFGDYGIEILECKKTPLDMSELDPIDLVTDADKPCSRWGDVAASISILGMKKRSN